MNLRINFVLKWMLFSFITALLISAQTSLNTLAQTNKKHPAIQESSFPRWVHDYDSTITVSKPIKVKRSGKVAKEYYTKDIYFTGQVVNDSLRVGTWKGYDKKHCFVKAAYMKLDDSTVQIMELDLRSKNPAKSVLIRWSIPF